MWNTDGEGNIVRSIDIYSKKEYNYYYEKGNLKRSTESDIILNSDLIVTSKTLVNTVIYSYDANGQLRKKRVIPVNGRDQVYYYDDPSDTNGVVGFETDGKIIRSRSKNDSFGRKEFDELQIGTGFLYRKFEYLKGEVTAEHAENGKITSLNNLIFFHFMGQAKACPPFHVKWYII